MRLSVSALFDLIISLWPVLATGRRVRGQKNNAVLEFLGHFYQPTNFYGRQSWYATMSPWSCHTEPNDRSTFGHIQQKQKMKNSKCLSRLKSTSLSCWTSRLIACVCILQKGCPYPHTSVPNAGYCCLTRSLLKQPVHAYQKTKQKKHRRCSDEFPFFHLLFCDSCFVSVLLCMFLSIQIADLKRI